MWRRHKDNQKARRKKLESCNNKKNREDKNEDKDKMQ